MDEQPFRCRDIQALGIVREALRDQVHDTNLIKLECIICASYHAIFLYRDSDYEKAKRLCKVEKSDVLRFRITEWDEVKGKRKEKLMPVDSWDGFRQNMDKIREYAGVGNWMDRTRYKNGFIRYPH